MRRKIVFLKENFKSKIKKIYLLLIGKAVIVDLSSLSIDDDELVTKVLRHMKPPVFIFGPPRSGSTYLVKAMNTHEDIYITNELRVMSFVNDLFRRFFSSRRMKWSLRPEFREYLINEMANVVRRFYLARMPAADSVWGDKHPHYADPAMDPGAIETILKLFPDAKFIHLYRNPRDQIYSVLQKGWKDFKYSVRAYRRIVVTGQALGRKVGNNRYLEIRYEDLINDGEKIADEICSFLSISPSSN